MTQEKIITAKEIKELGEDLLPINGIFNNDDDVVDKCKRILASLPIEDKTIMLLYIYTGSLRKVAEQLNVSHTLVYKNIKRIKNEYFNDLF